MAGKRAGSYPGDLSHQNIGVKAFQSVWKLKVFDCTTTNIQFHGLLRADEFAFQ